MSESILEMTPEVTMDQMSKVERLIAELHENGVRYCHWKSNLALSQSLAGQSDIDILVHREDAPRFREILMGLGFRPSADREAPAFPSIEHYFALDEASGVLVHVHSYYRVITGDSLVKNYRLPIESLLLENTRLESGLRVPLKSVELIVFTLRIMLKHTSLVELLLVGRYWKQVKQEAAWLRESGSLDETLGYLAGWLPTVDPGLFARCIAAIEAPAPLAERILLGVKLRSQLKSYARHSPARVMVDSLRKFADMVRRRLTRSHKELALRSGGAVIAFVGSEATGKSTLLDGMRHWLGEHFAVEQVHAGKPRSTTLTFLPNLFLPMLRSLMPGSRSSRLEAQYAKEAEEQKLRTSFPFIFVLRAALLAFDRRALLLRSFKQAANGMLVLCDRYPSAQPGAPDSPQLTPLAEAEGSSLRHRLARLEARWYREIPPPDLVIHLSAPLEITLTRNANRSKKEPEDYVRQRHARSARLQFERTRVAAINSDQPFEKTLMEVKQAIWSIL